MKQSRSDFFRILAVTLLIIVLAPAATYGTALLCRKTSLLPHVGSADAWIAFAGALAGGAITMIALYFTIRQAQKSAARQNELATRPYLFCAFENYDAEEKKLKIEHYIDDMGFIQWKMTNESDHIANHIRIVDECSYLEDAETHAFQKTDGLGETFGIYIYTVLLEDYISLPPRGEQHWRTNFTVELNGDGSYKWPGSAFLFRHTIVFEYTNILDSAVYRGRFDYDININVDVENRLHFWLWSASNTIEDIRA